MKKGLVAVLLAALLASLCIGCGETTTSSGGAGDTSTQTETSTKADLNAPDIEGLTYESTVELEYAERFKIYRYEGGYSVIRVYDGRDYILIPEGGEVPSDLPGNVTVMQKPLDDIYIQATSSMCFFASLDAMDHLRLSGTQIDGWYVDEAVEAMENGELIFAGKYSEPDYELLVSESCDLALESTMLLHNPEVLEKLEEMGIPVFIERSTYEKNPLAKIEWIKVIGEMVDEPEAAQEIYDVQKGYVQSLDDFENTEKTVAFFYVNDNGVVVTRKSSDYLPAMIELAGGRYCFENLGDPEKATSGVNMTMEEFYANTKDVDYLIYNASIADPLESIDDLIAINSLFADYKAVKEGNVWTTGKSLHQATDALGAMILDINTMLTNDSAEELTYMKRLH
ncbi:MAG: ABC transporter substrate-binding protein [Eubacterium sp.]|nr:ABC transporter substrate-binding protein [Eubacterium sp.]